VKQKTLVNFSCYAPPALFKIMLSKFRTNLAVLSAAILLLAVTTGFFVNAQTPETPARSAGGSSLQFKL
jgi:hypothetical protein